MAMNLREMSLPMQALLFAVLAVALIAAGLYVPMSPLKEKDSELTALNDTLGKLKSDISLLQATKNQLPTLQNSIQGVKNDIENLRRIIPAEKDADEFIRLLQGSASSAGVSIRRLKAQPVAARDQYYEMPFEVDVDGPYYAVSDFFNRLSKVSRMINVGDLNLKSTAEGSRKYPIRAGTTVSGTFVAVTFFTKATEEPAKSASGGAAPAKR